MSNIDAAGVASAKLLSGCTAIGAKNHVLSHLHHQIHYRTQIAFEFEQFNIEQRFYRNVLASLEFGAQLVDLVTDTTE